MIGTYIISSGMSVIGASIQRTNLEIIYHVRNNNPSGITTYIEHSAMPTLQQLMLNSCNFIFTMQSMCIAIFLVS
jgi:hypothetical protein